MTDLVYHSSSTRGIIQFKPRTSSHGVPYVYAAKEKVMSLLFARNLEHCLGDFSVYRKHDPKTGRLFLYERYEGAIDQLYGGVSASLYVLPKSLFLEGKTSWPEEVVSILPITPLFEMPIDDMHIQLQREVDRGTLRIYNHSNRPSFLPEDDEDLVFRAAIVGNKQRFKVWSPIHPKVCEVAQKILSDKSLRTQHLAKWVERYGQDWVVPQYKKRFPNDPIRLTPQEHSTPKP